MQLAPSLHRLGSSSLVNSYLIEDAGAITVIDAGLRGHWKDLLRELEAMGRSPVDIRALLLTHGDVDHLGFAERLRQEHGVPVFVGVADASEARGEVPKPAAVRDRMRLVPMAKFLFYGLTHGGLRSTPIKEVTPIDGATTLDVPGAPTAIPLPGHTPGSVAYQVPSLDAIFMGDAMTTRSVTTGVSSGRRSHLSPSTRRRPWYHSMPSTACQRAGSSPATAMPGPAGSPKHFGGSGRPGRLMTDWSRAYLITVWIGYRSPWGS